MQPEQIDSLVTATQKPVPARWLRPLYSLFVGLLGMGLLAAWLASRQEVLAWPVIAGFAALSFFVQRSSSALSSPVIHSLAGVIEIGAILTLGPAGGALVAVLGGITYLELDAFRRRRFSSRSLLEVPLFNAGLKAVMALLGGALYIGLNGPVPLIALDAGSLLATGVLCVTWFVAEHLGWGIWDWLDGGGERSGLFFRDAMREALLIGLLPLPLGTVLALVATRLGWMPFGLLAAAIAAMALLASRWANTRNELEQRVAELSTIEEVGRGIAQAQLDVDEICHLMYEWAYQIADATIFHLGLFEGDNYALKLWIREGDPLPSQTFQMSPGLGLVNWLRESKQPLLVRDFPKELDALPAKPACVSEKPPRSALYVPLIAGEEVIGTLSVQSFQKNAYAQGDVRVFSAMAHQAALAIQRARLYEAERQQAWLSTALLQVADAMGKVADMDAVLTTIVRLTPILAGVDRCALLMWDATRGTFVPVKTYGLGPELRDEFERLTFREGSVPALDLVRLERRPLYVSVPGEKELIPESLAQQFEIQEVVLLPLLAQTELLGVMMVDYAGKTHHTSERVMGLLAGIASQAAMVVKSAKLVQAQQEEAYVSMALLQVAEAVNRSAELDEILAKVVRITPILVGVDSCAIYLRRQQSPGLVPVVQYGLKGDVRSQFQELVLAEDHPVVGQLAGGSAFVRLEGDQGLADLASVFGPDVLFFFPLATKGEMLGLMAVGCEPGGGMLTERWRNILIGIAGQAAIAIENDRLLHEVAEQERLKQELEVAQRIQASFLPECCPPVAGWDVAAVWRSARQVSGDFYDFIPLPPARDRPGCAGARMGFVIADVADKGVPAALFMALSRTLVRTMAIDGRPPAMAIARANDLILADASSGLFVTLFYAVLQPDWGEITYVNAGHVPALLARAADGSVEELRVPGIALGILPEVEYEEHTAWLEPGDLLVLYTDGVTEAANTSMEMFGMERLKEVVSSHGQQPAARLASEINRAVEIFAGDAAQFDDVTLLVLRREK